MQMSCRFLSPVLVMTALLVSVSSQASARSPIAKIDLAINAVSAERGKVGALITG